MRFITQPPDGGGANLIKNATSTPQKTLCPIGGFPCHFDRRDDPEASHEGRGEAVYRQVKRISSRESGSRYWADHGDNGPAAAHRGGVPLEARDRDDDLLDR